MSLFQFTAEHISRNKALALVRELENKNIVVEYATMDQTFSNQMFIVIEGTETVAKEVRDRLWKENGGAYCDMSTMTAEELEPYL